MKFIFITIVVAILLGIVFHNVLDIDKSLTLPTGQKIKTILQNPEKALNASIINTVVVIVMENKSYNEIVGSTSAPYINSLINKYSFADDYFAVSHPSLPNYIALLGGSTFGITSDCTDCYINSVNLVDQLEQRHKTWKAYMDSMPSACFVGSSGEYAQKHNPFIYFDDIRNNPKRCQKIVPFIQLKSDLQSINSTPNFVWISPNLCNDMHDCSVNAGDTWLANNVSYILTSPAFTKQKSLLVITWDEGEGSGKNQIPIIFIGNLVKPGFVSHTLYTHYSLLKTIENIWSISALTANVSQSKSMSDMLSN